MNWYSFAGVVCLLIFLIGVGLLVLWYIMAMIVRDRQLKDIKQFIREEGKKLAVESISECMDIIPEKILEVKKTIEGE